MATFLAKNKKVVNQTQNDVGSEQRLVKNSNPFMQPKKSSGKARGSLKYKKHLLRESEQKKEKRLYLNKIAAAKCRQKKAIEQQKLNIQVMLLQDEIKKLKDDDQRMQEKLENQERQI